MLHTNDETRSPRHEHGVRKKRSLSINARGDRGLLADTHTTSRSAIARKISRHLVGFGAAICAAASGVIVVAPIVTPCAVGPHAIAHDVVLEAIPAMDSTVDEFPRHIQLTFSGVPKPSYNTVAISRSDTKEVLFSGQPTLDGRLVSIDIPDDLDPGPGDYIIGFQITSSDGHATRGMTKFSVAGHAASRTAVAPSSSSEATDSNSDTGKTSEGDSAVHAAGESSGLSVPMVLLFGGIALLVVGIGVVLLMKKKHQADG